MSARVHDVVVVGSGAAGGWVAKELCEAGLDVLLLEAGRAVDPATDFPLPAPPEGRLRARVRGALGGQPVQLRCAAFDQRTRRFFVSDRDSPYTTAAGAPFNWFRGRQVGGRLHVWARVVPRLSELELRGATRDGHGVDWPLSYDELAPWYDRVEAFLGVCGERDSLPAMPDGLYEGSIAMTPAEARFADAARSAFPDRPVVSPRVARHRSGRIPPALAAALETGRLTLRPDSVVRSVAVDPATGRATGVAFVDRVAREPLEARARAVVLCASTIETLRILLNSGSDRHPGGLGGSSGRLGRGLMDHVLTGIGGPLRDGAPPVSDGDPYDLGRVTGLQIPRFRNLAGSDAGFLRGYGIQGAIGRQTPHWYLLAHGEMLADDSNRVTLHPRRTDAWGVPVAHVRCAPAANETAMAADQIEVMRELAAAAGLRERTPPSGRPLEALAFRLWRRRLQLRTGAFVPGSAAHEIGGAAMGDDPARFVLDRFGRCWDAENVFVADGAAFPSGCWQNVTLTIMALAARAADHLAGELRAGRL